MCLGIPGKIIKIKDNGTADSDFGGLSKEISLRLLPEAKVGDFVLIHAGFALQKIDETEANETLKIIKKLAEIQVDDEFIS